MADRAEVDRLDVAVHDATRMAVRERVEGGLGVAARVAETVEEVMAAGRLAVDSEAAKAAKAAKARPPRPSPRRTPPGSPA